MGDVKSNMQASATPAEKVKRSGFLKQILGKDSKKETNEKKAETFKDMLITMEHKLGDLILTKRSDLKNESGKESENRQKLALLESMGYHLDSIIDLAEEYGDIK